MERCLSRMNTATLFVLIIPIIGSWNQTIELSFYLNLNFSRLKWQKNLNFTSEFIRLSSEQFFFRPKFYHDDFSCRAGDFIFKLVASSKFLVAMAGSISCTASL